MMSTHTAQTNTTTTTTSCTSSSGHKVVNIHHDCDLSTPPPPPPLPPPTHDLNAFLHQTHHSPHVTSKEPTPSSVSTSPASSHEDELSSTDQQQQQQQQQHQTAQTHDYDDSSTNNAAATITTTTNNNKNNTEFVNLIELAKTTLASTILASKIIQKHSTLLSSSSSSSSSSTSTSSKIQRTKNDGSIVTDADGESQRIITTYIHTISSQIRIVGEESNDEILISKRGYDELIRMNDHGHHDSGTSGCSGCSQSQSPSQSPGSSKRKWKMKEEKDEEYILKVCNLEIEKRFCNNYHTDKNNIINSSSNNSDQKPPPSKPTSLAGEEGERKLYIQNIHKVQASRISIYIDPLDGTSAYAKGQFEFVTILIGIMVDNVPVFGVIVKPFGHNGCNVDFKSEVYHNNNDDDDDDDDGCSRNDTASSSSCLNQHQQETTDQQYSSLGFQYPCAVLYGGTLLGGAFIFSGDELSRSRIHNHERIKPTENLNASILSSSTTAASSSSSSISSSTNQQRKAIISKSKGGGVVQKCINSLSSKGLLHPEPIYITGAGYKTMRLLLGTNNETMWFFPKPGTSLWDVAAADALLRVMGGRISDKYGKDLDYSKEWTDADNLDGIIACSDVDLHAKCIELYFGERWDDEDC